MIDGDRVVHEVRYSHPDYGVYNFNRGYYLESLRLLCATGRGKPFVVAGEENERS